MPESFVREMFADWLASERSKKKSWDIQNWLNQKKGDFKLHPESKIILQKILEENGFYLDQ